MNASGARRVSGDPLSSALVTLRSLGQELAGAYRIDTVANRVADVVSDILSPDQFVLALSDVHADDLTLSVVRGMEDITPRHPYLRVALKSGPIVLNDRLETYFTDGMTQRKPASWVGAPITAVGRTLGAAALGSFEANRYRQLHLDILEAILSEAAIAIVNARLMSLLAEGKKEWEQTFDAISEAFCILDESGLVRRANRAFCELVDAPLKAVTGRPWHALLPPDWCPPVVSVLEQPGERTAIEDENRVLSVSSFDIRGDQSRADSVLIFQDETETRRLQHQLIQSEKMSAVGQLIAGVAHDLNNPLASVVGFADYLLEKPESTPENMLEPLKAIQQEAERAAAIVRNLLSFARKQEGRHTPHQIGSLINSTLVLLNNQLMAQKVETVIHIEPDLPPVSVDENKIKQVFVNLISNAAQAIAGSGIGGTITVRAERWLDGIAVNVEDDGPGIPSAVAERIFEPFFTTKREQEGTGLGLSICQGLIKEHGGHITLVDSSPGRTCFRVELPAGVSIVPEPDEVSAGPGPLAILVVDDEPHILHYMKAALESWGHIVTVAVDGAEALERIEQSEPDLVVTDIRMPRLSGRELYERLLDNRPRLADRLVFSTGDTVRGDTLEFLESFGRPFLKKPFSLKELKTLLSETEARLLSRRRSAPE